MYVLLQQRKKQLLYGVLDILYGTFWCCICHEHPASIYSFFRF
jgi:hypothetical protein